MKVQCHIKMKRLKMDSQYSTQIIAYLLLIDNSIILRDTMRLTPGLNLFISLALFLNLVVTFAASLCIRQDTHNSHKAQVDTPIFTYTVSVQLNWRAAFSWSHQCGTYRPYLPIRAKLVMLDGCLRHRYRHQH